MYAQYAGILYEKEFMPLLQQIHRSYSHRLGPGDLPGKRKDTERVYGVLVPHSPYAVAGPGMAWGYKLLSEHYFPETYVLLVPDTQNIYTQVVLVQEDIETVFGICVVDRAFSEKLLAQGIVSGVDDVQEFALELQILFLQQASRDRAKVLKVLPLIVPAQGNFSLLAEALLKIKKDIVVVIASDFHQDSSALGQEGGFVGDDKYLIRSLLHLDRFAFERSLEKYALSFLGRGALSLGVEILKKMGVSQGEIVNYYSSSEVSAVDEGRSFVSLVF